MTRIKSLRLTDEEWVAIEKAATDAHMSAHAWIRAIINATLGLSELPRHLRRVRSGAKDGAPPQ